MGTLLLLVYIILFFFHVFLLGYALRHDPKRKLRWVCLSELASLLAALLILWVSDHAPGTGIMPGLTYFDVSIYSLGAAVLFAALLLVSLMIGAFAAAKNQKSDP